MSRSMIHMLTVAASRIEQEYGSKQLIADLRAAAKHHADARSEGRHYNVEDQKRIERQRTLFAMLPDTAAVDRLKAAMLQRAYDLLWDGDCLACDALSEFLPSSDVERMLTAWENDQRADAERSEFFSATTTKQISG